MSGPISYTTLVEAVDRFLDFLAEYFCIDKDLDLLWLGLRELP